MQTWLAHYASICQMVSHTHTHLHSQLYSSVQWCNTNPQLSNSCYTAWHTVGPSASILTNCVTVDTQGAIVCGCCALCNPPLNAPCRCPPPWSMRFPQTVTMTCSAASMWLRWVKLGTHGYYLCHCAPLLIWWVLYCNLTLMNAGKCSNFWIWHVLKKKKCVQTAGSGNVHTASSITRQHTACNQSAVSYDS